MRMKKIRKVLELAGVKDILSKSYGTTNKVNNTKGTFEALRELKATPRMLKREAEKAKKKAEMKKKTDVKKTEAKKVEPKAKKTEAKKAPAKTKKTDEKSNK